MRCVHTYSAKDHLPHIRDIIRARNNVKAMNCGPCKVNCLGGRHSVYLIDGRLYFSHHEIADLKKEIIASRFERKMSRCAEIYQHWGMSIKNEQSNDPKLPIMLRNLIAYSVNLHVHRSELSHLTTSHYSSSSMLAGNIIAAAISKWLYDFSPSLANNASMYAQFTNSNRVQIYKDYYNDKVTVCVFPAREWEVIAAKIALGSLHWEDKLVTNVELRFTHDNYECFSCKAVSLSDEDKITVGLSDHLSFYAKDVIFVKKDGKVVKWEDPKSFDFPDKLRDYMITRGQ